jgi:DNA-binding NarL/FixJ family response regulator
MELTPRQLEILRRLADGDGDKQIAAALGASVFTVRYHIRVMLSTAGKHTRAGLVWFHRMQLLTGRQETEKDAS